MNSIQLNYGRIFGCGDSLPQPRRGTVGVRGPFLRFFGGFRLPDMYANALNLGDFRLHLRYVKFAVSYVGGILERCFYVYCILLCAELSRNRAFFQTEFPDSAIESMLLFWRRGIRRGTKRGKKYDSDLHISAYLFDS